MPGIGNVNIGNIVDKTNAQSNKNSTENLKKKLENAKEDKHLMKACQEFESIFVHMMLKQMRATVPEGGLVEKSQGEEIFEDMYDQEIAKNISQSQNQGIGLAKIIYQQMKQNRGNL
ncbi:rod-binding protein [Sporosalibacterium faouarense]|uniref:rod-binding protein n=1 Tax=Sporosalibacterium faouarense TaxID=516123 RepID=UPI00141C9AA4|nr:rod-binding protein [Sporosalibacterium faouarense]MTI46851.1 flagellar biosynthesis protein FlgJ [Bacillota bacterium]